MDYVLNAHKSAGHVYIFLFQKYIVPNMLISDCHGSIGHVNNAWIV
jgi:hypothetical protein